MGIEEILDRIAGDWAVPHSAIHDGRPTLFQLRCTILPAPGFDVDASSAPPDLRAFWRHAGGARLFEDVEFGQWGLVLFGPEEADEHTSVFRRARSRQYLTGDLIVGCFLGDQELLLVRCDPGQEDYGQVLVVLPLDSRKEWFRVASGFRAFLEGFARAEGAKYWERS